MRRKRPGDPDRIIGHYAISDKKRLRDLEAENAKLKRMSADRALENAATYQLAI